MIEVRVDEYFPFYEKKFTYKFDRIIDKDVYNYHKENIQKLENQAQEENSKYYRYYSIIILTFITFTYMYIFRDKGKTQQKYSTQLDKKFNNFKFDLNFLKVSSPKSFDFLNYKFNKNKNWSGINIDNNNTIEITNRSILLIIIVFTAFFLIVKTVFK